MDRSKPATHSISLHMTVNDPTIWQNKWQLLNDLAKKSEPHACYVSVTSSLLETMDDLHDEGNILVKVFDVLFDLGIADSTAKDIVKKLLEVGIRFREKE